MHWICSSSGLPFVNPRGAYRRFLHYDQEADQVGKSPGGGPWQAVREEVWP